MIPCLTVTTCSDTDLITNLYTSLPTSMGAFPQLYHVHCNFDSDPRPWVSFAMGDAKTMAIDFCRAHSKHISCSQQSVREDAPDRQLTLTWNASTVLKMADFFSDEPSTYGDHFFMCEAHTHSSKDSIETEHALITVRGKYSAIHIS